MKNLHNKDSLAPKTAQKKTKRPQNSPLQSEIEAFLTTDNPPLSLYGLTMAIDKLKLPPQQVKPMVKEAIKENIKRYNLSADESGVYVKTVLADVFADFSTSDFIERKWQYIPFILHDSDYQELQRQEKTPIYIDHYDYSAPIYSFKNNFQFTNEDLKKKKKENSNDAKFYMSKDEKILFSKVTTLTFTPVNFKLVREYKRNATPEEKERMVYLPTLYDRTLTISMYVLLEGSSNKSHMFLRYDSSSKTHKNIYVGSDKRQSVYGLEAENPHFHFQNEDDNLLCIKKFRDANRHIKWKTGRCNAIDCKHLIKYLLELDSLSQEKLEELSRKNLHYNMPFLHAKLNKKTYSMTSVDKLLDNYTNDGDQFAIDYSSELKRKFKLYYPQKTVGVGEQSFKKLITSLQFLQFLYEERIDTTDLRKLEMLSQIEVITATEVVNKISNNKDKAIEKEYKPKYVIEGDYLQNETR